MPIRLLHAFTFAAAAAVLLFTPLHAQDWKLVESGVTDNLYDIFFVNKQVGWAVGADSTIIKTTDEGATWFQQTGGYAEEYRCVYFLDEQRGWIGGTGGLVLHTTDGGESWEKQETELLDTVNDIDFVNDSVGWLTGEIIRGDCGHWGNGPCGAVLRTSNAGAEWVVKLQTPVKDTVSDNKRLDGRLNTIDFITEEYGCVGSDWLSDLGDPGSVICTSDGGENWSNYPSEDRPSEGRFPWVYDIHVVSKERIYIGTHRALFSTNDSGRTDWIFKLPPARVYDIDVPSVDHMYAITGRDGVMRVKYYQNDEREGKWQILEGNDFGGPGYTANYMGLCMLDTATGWICGDGGKLWRYPSRPTGVSVREAEYTSDFTLSSLYPNPVENGPVAVDLNIEYILTVPMTVKIEIYNYMGELIETRELGSRSPGIHHARIALGDIGAGNYFCVVHTGGANQRTHVQPFVVR